MEALYAEIEDCKALCFQRGSNSGFKLLAGELGSGVAYPLGPFAVAFTVRAQFYAVLFEALVDLMEAEACVSGDDFAV